MDDEDDGMLSMDDDGDEDGQLSDDVGANEDDEEEYIICHLDPEEAVGSKVKADDEFPCEIVSAEKVVQQMTEIIRDVNVVIQV